MARCYAPGMRGPTDDTDPRIGAVLIDGYRAMTSTEKLERVAALTRTVRSLALADVRRRHPASSEREQALRVASRWIPPDLMLRAFGWDVDDKGY